MLRMSAKAVFNDHTKDNVALVRRSTRILPELFVVQFRKNVAPITPKKTGALRRSIITTVSGGVGRIAWRLPYAADQEAGVDSKTGKPYHHWTTPGTGPHFMRKAYAKTYRDMQATLRQLGLK